MYTSNIHTQTHTNIHHTMTKPINKIYLLSHYFPHSYTTNPHTEGQALYTYS